MARSRILFVHRATGSLGDGIRIDRVFRFLSESGFKTHRVRLPSLSPSYFHKAGFADIIANLIPLHRLSSREPPAPIVGYLNRNIAENFLSRQIRQFEFDLIVAETVSTGWQLLDLAERTAKPLIVDVHGLAGAEAKGGKWPFWNLIEAAETETFRRSTHLTVVSQEMKSHIMNSYGIPAEKLTVVYNGADPPQTFAEFKHPLGVIFAGQLSYWEKAGDYLELAKAANNRDFRFYMAGSGPFKKPLTDRIKKQRIPINYLGYLPRSEALLVMSQMQIGVAPSTRDIARQVAFPIKVLDYMACGLPVLAPRVGEWGNMIERENCGVALVNDTPDAYVAGLNEIAIEKNWKSKSSNGVEVAREKFYWEKVLLPLGHVVTQFAK